MKLNRGLNQRIGRRGQVFIPDILYMKNIIIEVLIFSEYVK
jgi:hypothetical protein